MALSKEELHYYNRQLILSEVGHEGQAMLKDSAVLVIGAGGLGCPALQYMAGAGIGKIGIADFDKVSVSNLHRQTIYTYNDNGKWKCDAAANFVKNLNPFIEVVPYKILVSEDNILELISGYDIVLDCTDNPLSKYLINDACITGEKALVYGSVFKMEGNVTVFNLNDDSPTLRCLFPEPDHESPDCERSGILGIVPGITGMQMAIEAIKMILGNQEILNGKLLITNFATGESRIIGFKPDFRSREISKARFTTMLPSTISPSTLKMWMESGEVFDLVDVRSEKEHEFTNIGGKLIPLDEFEDHWLEIDKYKKTVIYCHHGIRSLNAVEFLQEQGFQHVFSLEGGIHAWSMEVDQNIKIY